LILKKYKNEVSSNTESTHHKRTKRVSECDLKTTQAVDSSGKEDVDPVVAKLSKIGCLEKHYKVQDCYFETKDWRKCTKEVKEFQECVSKSKQEKDN
jgi:cytochrome c oxidase assembly factor 4